MAGWSHSLPYIQLKLLGGTGLPSLQIPIRAGPGAAQLEVEADTDLTHIHRAPGPGMAPGGREGCVWREGLAPLTLRVSAGGEMSLRRWVSKASPEAPPCSTPAEAPQTCTHNSNTAYTLVRMVLRAETAGHERSTYAPEPCLLARLPSPPSLYLTPSQTVTCKASPGQETGSPGQHSRR